MRTAGNLGETNLWERGALCTFLIVTLGGAIGASLVTVSRHELRPR